MNWIHNRICRSEGWAGDVAEDAIPWALAASIWATTSSSSGRGSAPRTEPLSRRVPRLTALEFDPVLGERLRRRMGASVEVQRREDAFRDASQERPEWSISEATSSTSKHQVAK